MARGFQYYLDQLGLPRNLVRIDVDFSGSGIYNPIPTGEGNWSGTSIGNPNTAYGNFDGNSYINLTDSGSFSNDNWTMFFTFERSGYGNHVLFSNYEGNINKSGFVIGVNSANNLYLETYDQNGPLIFESNIVLASKNAVSVSKTPFNLNFEYLDFNTKLTDSENFNLFNISGFYNSENFHLGAAPNSPNYFSGDKFSGQMDNFIYLTGNLMPYQVDTLFQGFTLLRAPQLYYTIVDEECVYDYLNLTNYSNIVYNNIDTLSYLIQTGYLANSTGQLSGDITGNLNNGTGIVSGYITGFLDSGSGWVNTGYEPFSGFFDINLYQGLRVFQNNITSGISELFVPFSNNSNYSIISGIGTIISGDTDTGNHCDDCVTPVTLPFPVYFYGQTFTGLNVSSNGNIQFISQNDTFEPGCLPDNTMDYLISPYGTDLYDLDSADGQGIFTSVVGTAPNRTLNIEFRMMPCCYDVPPTTNFEVCLHENTSNFEIIYGSLSPEIIDFNQVLVGAQKDTGSQFTQFACDERDLIGLFSGLQLNFIYEAVNPSYIPVILNEFDILNYTGSGNLLVTHQISGVSTSGFFADFSETISQTGYILNTFTCPPQNFSGFKAQKININNNVRSQDVLFESAFEAPSINAYGAANGITGNNIRKYVVEGHFNNGDIILSPEIIIPNSNSNLSASGFNVIFWDDIGADTYIIYRTVSSGSPSTTGAIFSNGYVGGGFNDFGTAGDNSSVPSPLYRPPVYCQLENNIEDILINQYVSNISNTGFTVNFSETTSPNYKLNYIASNLNISDGIEIRKDVILSGVTGQFIPYTSGYLTPPITIAQLVNNSGKPFSEHKIRETTSGFYIYFSEIISGNHYILNSITFSGYENMIGYTTETDLDIQYLGQTIDEACNVYNLSGFGAFQQVVSYDITGSKSVFESGINEIITSGVNIIPVDVTIPINCNVNVELGQIANFIYSVYYQNNGNNFITANHTLYYDNNSIQSEPFYIFKNCSQFLGQQLENLIYDYNYIYSFGMDGVAYIGLENVNDYSSLIIYPNVDNKTNINKIGLVDRTVGDYFLDNLYNLDQLNLYENGVGLMGTGYAASGFSGDYYLNNYYAVLEDNPDDSAAAIYDIISGDQRYYYQIPQDYLEISGNYYLPSLEPFNLNLYLNGVKLETGITYFGERVGNADLIRISDDLYSATGKIFTFPIEIGIMKYTGYFDSQLTNRFAKGTSMLWANGIRQTLNSDYIEIPSISLLTGNKTENLLNNNIFNNRIDFWE